MEQDDQDRAVRERLCREASRAGLEVTGGRLRRTSSRFCLGVEHGDYNGTELFGLGTDRFIWLLARPNTSGRVRLLSLNFPAERILEFTPGRTPPPRSPEIAGSWFRFPLGADHILRQTGFATGRGLDGILLGNIPGGGMSRSASLSLNLILTFLEINRCRPADAFQPAELARAVETEYIGAPCGLLDQVMILFARAGMGTHYRPGERKVTHLPLGSQAGDICFVSLDTGTTRPGLEHSTYKVRVQECRELLELARQQGFELASLAQAWTRGVDREIEAVLGADHPHLCRRLRYLAGAQARFPRLLQAWRRGDLVEVGRIFRLDGLGLRDDYAISGPELETMCDIARTVPGVLGERMLGGGDRGAAGALVRRESLPALKEAVARAYPLSHPGCADRFALHSCSLVDGVTIA